MSHQKTIAVHRSVPDHQTNQSDDALLLFCATFQTIDGKLDRLVECEADAPEQELLSLHAQWIQAIWQVSCIPARTRDGQRAKAAVLLAALRVVLEADPSPHDLLAASLARDLAGSDGKGTPVG